MNKKNRNAFERLENDREHWINRYVAARKVVDVLERENKTLAGWLMSEWVTVHESKVAEVDQLLIKYLGDTDEQ